MLRLDYALSSGWEHSTEIALSDAEEWVLRYDCFLGDVVFMVYEADLSARWGWVPVLDFALAIDSIVDSLASCDGVEELFEFTESDATILFRRVGDVVEIDASYAAGVAEAGYANLRGEAKRFLLRVLKELSSEYPDLRTNPFIVRRC